MNKSERRRFLRELIRNVKADLILSSDQNTWDGFELRWLAAEHFNRAAYGSHSRRKRAYNNEVIVRDL